MGCSNYENLFSGYIDGELAREDREAIRFHLNGCHRCLTKLEDMQRTVQAVQGLTALKLRQGFNDSLQQRLHQEVTNELYTKPFWSRWTETFDDLYRFACQRPVQVVFATSMLLTMIFGAMTWKNIGQHIMQPTTPIARFDLPTPIEPEPAVGQIMAPLPVESEPASYMVLMALRPSEMRTTVIIPALTISDLVSDLDFEVLGMLPSIETAASGMDIPTLSYAERPNELSVQPVNHAGRRVPSMNDRSSGLYNSFVPGLRSPSVNLQQQSQRYILPSVPSKRITRVIF